MMREACGSYQHEGTPSPSEVDTYGPDGKPCTDCNGTGWVSGPIPTPSPLEGKPASTYRGFDIYRTGYGFAAAIGEHVYVTGRTLFDLFDLIDERS